MKRQLYRQGDVLLVGVTSIPKGTTVVPREDGRLVLARGEATGHAHVILEESAQLVTDEQARELYLLVHGGAPVALVHDEHDTVLVAPNSYQVRRQREYSPAELRTVSD